MLQVLSRLDEDSGIFFEQTQEPIFLFGGKMFPDQEINILIVVRIKVSDIPGNEEGYGEEKNTDKALAFHLPHLFREFKRAALCTTYLFFAFR